MSFAQILQGDVLARLADLPDESVQCVVTSPPYWGLRDYGVEGQIGLEATAEEFIAKLVEVFREVKRVLKNEGTLWLNIGDTYKENSLSGIPWHLAFALKKESWLLRSEIIWAKKKLHAGIGKKSSHPFSRIYFFIFKTTPLFLRPRGHQRTLFVRCGRHRNFSQKSEVRY